MVSRKPKAAKKIRTNISLDPALKAAVRKLQGDYSNLSEFLEMAAWKEIKRAMRLGPNLGPKSRKMGK